jgi:hypothetical protein
MVVDRSPPYLEPGVRVHSALENPNANPHLTGDAERTQVPPKEEGSRQAGHAGQGMPSRCIHCRSDGSRVFGAAVLRSRRWLESPRKGCAPKNFDG